MNEQKKPTTDNSRPVIKTLLIVRHAKSSWGVEALTDFERPLNDRGKKDAPVMAQRLLDKNIQIDAFVSSPAKRAKKTAELFAEVYGYKVADINFLSALYQAPVSVFAEVIAQLEDDINSVALFSHNPGITSFVNSLVPEKVQLDNMPTCAVFAIQAHITKWADFEKAKKEFLFFDYPKLNTSSS